jgi:hypothetical protein
MFILEIILIFIILGISSGLFSKFIDFCFNEGNIFDFYYLFIITHIEPVSPKLAKMLGVCNTCFNFWFSTFLFPVFLYLLGLNFKIEYFYLYFIYISFSCTISLFLNKNN